MLRKWYFDLSLSLSLYLSLSLSLYLSLYLSQILDVNLATCVNICVLNVNQVLEKIVKQSRYRSGVAQKFPGGLGSQNFMTFGTWRWWVLQPHAPAAFTPEMFLVPIFTRGWVDPHGHGTFGRKYVTEKSSDTTGFRSRDRPSSIADWRKLSCS